MATVIITKQPTSVTVIPGQNTTFSVTASADFASPTYKYQWKLGGANISGATDSAYFIDPIAANNGNSYTVSVSALSGTSLQATVLSNAAVLTVTAESSPFDTFAVYPETGAERFKRLRHLGYV